MSAKTTFRFRLRDKHASRLDAQARAVNVVWNYCNETQQRAARDGRRWQSANALGRLCSGATKEGLDLLANSVEQVCRQYDRSRRAKRQPWLRFRGEKSLGWIPVKDGDISVRGGALCYRGERYEGWFTRDLAEGQRFKGSWFSRDARGRWYVNLTADAPKLAPATGAVGIDLGLKTLATLSDGATVATMAAYRRDEHRIAQAQRGNRKRLKRTLHARIAARRADHLHKASARIARDHALIVVGNVSPSNLAKTKLAKSIMDAGWSDFRRMLSYKALRHGGRYLEVSEAYTTQTCSECGSIAGPRGYAGLNERMWQCDCGAVHDRDVNAARNILRLGLQALAGGAAKAERSIDPVRHTGIQPGQDQGEKK